MCRIRRPALQIPGLVVLVMLRFYGFHGSQSVSPVLNLLSVGGPSEVGHFLTRGTSTRLHRIIAVNSYDPAFVDVGFIASGVYGIFRLKTTSRDREAGLQRQPISQADAHSQAGLVACWLPFSNAG
jgi:hypothetical protein